MLQLNLKPNHKAVRDYYLTLQQYDKLNKKGAVLKPRLHCYKHTQSPPISG